MPLIKKTSLTKIINIFLTQKISNAYKKQILRKKCENYAKFQNLLYKILELNTLCASGVVI